MKKSNFSNQNPYDSVFSSKECSRSGRRPDHIGRSHSGFTLVELMVVIVIIAVLGTFAFMMATRATDKAKSVDMVNRMRQTGTFLFASASDNAGMISVFVGGNGHHSNRLLAHVATGLSFNPLNQREHEQIYQASKDIVYTPATDPGKYHPWEVFGINLDDNVEFGVRWNTSWEEDENGTEGRISKIRVGSARRSASYPLVSDSSNEKGVPRLRFGNGNDHKFAMRFNGKGTALFLDGSARSISPFDMADYGITHAYLFEDGPNSPPSLVRSRRR